MERWWDCCQVSKCETFRLSPSLLPSLPPSLLSISPSQFLDPLKQVLAMQKVVPKGDKDTACVRAQHWKRREKRASEEGGKRRGGQEAD